MKKAFVAFTLLMFVGTMAAPVYAAASGNTSVSVVKHDDKKKKKSKK